MVKRAKTFLWVGVIIIIVLIVVGRMHRQAKNDALSESYSGVVAVTGFVVQPESYTRFIEGTAVLEGNKESMVAAETGGRVLSVKVNVGDNVSAGTPMVRLDDELYQLESERAKVAYDKAKMDFDRLQKLFDQKSVSESDLEGARLGMKGAEVQYRLALKTFNDATIKAPFSGTVAAKMTEVGQTIERGMPVVQLVDISTLKLTINVSENDVTQIADGAQAIVIIEAAGETVQGKVTAVGSRATTGSRLFPVEISIPGNKKLRSGMFARTQVSASTQGDALLLPRVAVLPDAGNTVVFLAHQGAAKKAIVKVLNTQGDRVAVTGIAPGDTVLTVGNQNLAQGTPISLTMETRRAQ